MSTRYLLTFHPCEENYDQNLKAIEDLIVDRFGLEDDPYADIPSVHPDYSRDFRDNDGDAHNAVAVDPRVKMRNYPDIKSLAQITLNRVPAKYATKVFASDHEWDATAWLYTATGNGVEVEMFGGEPGAEGRDLERKLENQFGIEPHIPLF